METRELDLEAPGGQLLAAIVYLSALAYPESLPKRDRFIKAVLALMNRAARDLKLPVAPYASELFREVPRALQAKRLGTGKKGAVPRIRRRLLMAKAASAALADGTYRANRVTHRTTLNDLADRDGNASYFFRVWAETKPVLHLALALRGVLFHWNDDGRPLYVQLLARPSWVRDALRSAENWRAMLSAGDRVTDAPAFMREIKPENFIVLLPATHRSD